MKMFLFIDLLFHQMLSENCNSLRVNLQSLYNLQNHYDCLTNQDWIANVPNAEYVSLEELLTRSNIISIHVPLLPETHHMINKETIAKMPKNVIIVSIFINYFK